MKKLFMLLIVLLMAGCTTEGELDLKGIEERGYIVMGLDDTFAPMGFRDESGNIVGLDVDLAKELFSRANLELRFQPIDWAMKETELNSGNIDMIWNGYTITEERQEKVNFSRPYLANRQVIITLSEDINTISDLEGLSIGTQSSSSSYDAIMSSELVNLVNEDDIILFSSYTEAFIDLEANRVDAIVADEILARYYISKKDLDYKVLSEDLGKEEYGIGVRKESTDLLNLINSLLDEMKEEGKSKEISIKWFSEDIVK